MPKMQQKILAKKGDKIINTFIIVIILNYKKMIEIHLYHFLIYQKLALHLC